MLRVASFYRFAPVTAPDALAARLAGLAQGLRGTVLVAREGINGSLAGDAAALAAFRAALAAEPGLADLPWTEGVAATMPFDRLRIRLRPEIVTMGIPGVDPTARTGTPVDPADWNALIAAPDVVTIDTRNAYEVRLGSFDGAIDPGTAGFRDFPAWWDRNRAALAGRRVAMFCTGGIRCEKASAWLLSRGVDAVLQLRGGILGYLAAIPPAQSRWHGDCFVFDGRVAVGHGLAPAPVALCHACRGPVTAADRAHPDYVPGIACPHCATTRSEAQRARYRARAAQIAHGRRTMGAAPHG
ncbi:MAG: rhodanese-related sulfurtransferase [Gemmobacter sp.]